MKLRVGIFFGGPSREREISFAGGRTVYDNLDKSLFDPIPVFVDSFRNFVLLDWQHIYKGSIRDFFPPVEALPDSPHQFQIYEESLGQPPAEEIRSLLRAIGRPLAPEELEQHIDLAFLALHGLYGEDGQIQEQLTALGIPYTGSGIAASRIGMDKAWQKELMQECGFPTPRIEVLDRADWARGNPQDLYDLARERIGFPLVVRPSRQGSSIGVSIVDEKAGAEGLFEAVQQAFFRERIPLRDWHQRSDYERMDHLRLLTDIRDGLAFPMTATLEDQQLTCYHPEELFDQLNAWAEDPPEDTQAVAELESFHLEDQVLLEAFIEGKEFSCIAVSKENGEAVALPPTEIVKSGAVYDYRSKYLPGLSRKRTPIDLPEEQVHAIRERCTRLFGELGFQVYARIDGFIRPDGTIYLNDPNTTSGMLPSSFFFHQAAEIGLNPSQFLTFILRLSLQERLAEAPGAGRWQVLLDQLDGAIRTARLARSEHRRIGVILGGYSYERHISVESGRNIYEKLASSEIYEPIPLFLSRRAGALQLHRLPVSLLLKDHADDILDAVEHHGLPHPALARIREECQDITAKYAASDVIFQPEPWSFQRLQEEVDAVFIALHGRPGEDGELQRLLEGRSIPYNGSGPVSSAITIDKYRTLQTLKANGFSVADQFLLRREHYHNGAEAVLNELQDRFGFPLVAKPVDDGCSSAVKVIRHAAELKAYLRLLFREPGTDFPESRRFLRLHPNEEFPRKETALIESLTTAAGAERFLEVTVGMLTHLEPDGALRYEVFEPSETLAGGEVLSLEEKFLAGQGQNITPARFGENYEAVAGQVKADVERAARILQVEGYCRIDAFVRVYSPSEVETVIIEVNSLPGMTPATAIFHQAALHGYKPYEFIDQILQFAFARHRRSRGLPEAAASAPAISPDATAEAPPREQTQNPNPLMSNTAARGEAPWWKRRADRLLETLGQWLRQLWAFLSSPVFLKNFGIWLALLLALYLLLLGWLRLYTKHGESLQVHNYVGMELDDAMKLARNRSFRIEVSDSVYQYEKPPGTVIQQDPPPESRVKKNRTIYLVINRKRPPMVALPDLSGSDDFQVYCDYLKRLNIECIVKDRVYHGRLEPNTILHFYYKGRKITASQLKRGVEVPRGCTLEFVITERQSDAVPIPNLICTGYAEAEFVITNSQLAVGAVYGGVDDPGTAYVYRQEPDYLEGKQVPIGTQINLYIQQKRPENCPGGEVGQGDQ